MLAREYHRWDWFVAPESRDLVYDKELAEGLSPLILGEAQHPEHELNHLEVESVHSPHRRNQRLRRDQAVRRPGDLILKKEHRLGADVAVGPGLRLPRNLPPLIRLVALTTVPVTLFAGGLGLVQLPLCELSKFPSAVSVGTLWKTVMSVTVSRTYLSRS